MQERPTVVSRHNPTVKAQSASLSLKKTDFKSDALATLLPHGHLTQWLSDVEVRKSAEFKLSLLLVSLPIASTQTVTVWMSSRSLNLSLSVLWSTCVRLTTLRQRHRVVFWTIFPSLLSFCTDILESNNYKNIGIENNLGWFCRIFSYHCSCLVTALHLVPPPSSPFVQQEAPLSSLPAGQRGGQRGHRGARCCLMAVRTGRAPLQMWCQLLPGVTLERPMAACPPPAHPPHPSISAAGSLLNPPQGEGAGGHTGRYMFPTYRYSLWENTQISEPSRSKASNIIYFKE